jgi:hypothetical protein
MDERETIVAAGNTLTPIFLTLKAKGYRVSREEIGNEFWWIAKTDEKQFVGSDVVELLALATMREMRGPEWQATDAEIKEFMAMDGTE